MSQVKKLETGSTVDKKLGSLTVNGIKYDATPEMLQALSQHLGVYGESAAPLSGVMSALQNGEDLVYEGVGNTITGNLDPYSGVSDRMNEKRKVGASNWRKNWQATFNTDAHQFRKALHYLNGFSGASAGSDTDASKLTDILGDRRWFNYDPDSKAYLESGEDNLAIDKRLADWTAFLGMDEDTAKKTYNVSAYGDPKVAGIRQLYAQNKDKWDTVLGQIKERAKAGTLTAEDKAFLKNFNIYEDAAKAAEDAEKKNADADRKRYTDAGFDYDKWSPLISWDPDKNTWIVSSSGAEALRNNFGGNGYYWFDDLFKKSNKYNPNGENDYLYGYFILGDRIYNQADAKDPNSELYKILHREGGFRELNAAMKHGEANNLIQYLWDNEIGYDRPTGEYYSNWLDPNGNRWYRSANGSYDWDGRIDGQQLAEFVEANPENADEFGFYTPQYMVTDRYGNIDINNPTMLDASKVRTTGKDAAEFRMNRLWRSDAGNSEFDGRYLWGDSTDENGKVSGLGLWIHPDPEKGWVIESDRFKQLVNGLNDNSTIKLPPVITRILASNPQFFEALRNNDYFRDKFIRGVADIVSGSWNSAATEVPASAWASVGFTPEQVIALRREFKKISNPGNRGNRRSQWMIAKPTLHKSGGVVKAQLGRMVGKSAGNKATPTQVKSDKPMKETGDFAVLGKDKLQTHDWIELGAALADLGSTALAFIPGANIASGAAGVAGSTAGFVADVRRDGFQGNDLGQYLLNLGLDSVAFLPGLSGVAKSAKAVRTLEKVAPHINRIMKAAATYGISSAAVQSWNAIQRGDFNTRDLRTVVNALSGAVHVARAGVRNPQKTVKGKSVTEFNEVTLKPKEGKNLKEVKLSKKEVEEISKLNPEEQSKKILEKFKAKDGNSEATLNDIEGLVDKNKGGIRWKFWESWQKTPTLPEDAVTTNKGEKQKVDRKHQNWFNGGLQRQKDYVASLGGKQRERITVKTKELVPEGEWRPVYGTQHDVVVPNPQNLPAVIGTNYNVPVVGNTNLPAIPITRRVIINEADKALPVPMREVVREKSRYRRFKRVTPTTSGVIWTRDVAERQSPEEVIPYEPQYNGNAYFTPYVSANQPSYKKGGIIKDQSPAGPLAFDPNWKPKLDVDLGPGIAINGTGNGVTQKYMDLYGNITERPQYTGYAPSVTTSTTTTPTTIPATTSSTSTEESASGNGNGKNTYGPWEGKAFQFDPTVPLNWLRAGVSMGLSDKQFRRFRDRPRLRLINPNLNAPRYINNGEGDAYRTAANTTRMFKPTSSNALTNDIGLRQRQQQATQYDLQGSLADSKNYGAYKQGLDAFNNEQFLRNLDFANKRRELDWKHDIETIQAANANTSQKSKFFDQAAYSTQDWITQQMQKSNMYRYMKESNPERLAIMDTYQREYNAAMKLTGDAQTEALRNAKWKAEQALEQLKLKSYGVGLYAPFTHFVKSGGKISKDSGSKNSRVTYSRDPYPDLLLQNSKAVDKFIEQLSDHTIKLILDSKPLYVS